MPHTIQLHRVFAAPADRIYRAFLDAPALARWLPPNGFTGTVHDLDARVGGRYRMSFTNFTTGNGHSFGGEYLELVPGQRIAYTGEFDAEELAATMTTTVRLTQVSCGTEMHITQEGIPDMIPAEQCHLGWQQSLAHLATLVETEIPD